MPEYRTVRNINAGNGLVKPGEIVELDDNTAKELLADGAIEAVNSDQTDTASASEAPTAPEAPAEQVAPLAPQQPKEAPSPQSPKQPTPEQINDTLKSLNEPSAPDAK